MNRPDGLRTCALALGLTVFLIFVPHACPAQTDPAAVLKQAQSEKDPLKRLQVLDRAIEAPVRSTAVLARLHFERGMAHKELQDCFQAIKDFNAALLLPGDMTPARLEKAHCLILIDQLEEASKVIERLLLVQPTLGRCYVLKGLIYEHEGFPSKAADEYSRALHFEPHLTNALLMRANVLVKEGRPREAIEDLNELVLREPKRVDALIARARIHVKLRQYEQALADYGRVEALGPQDERLTKEKVRVFLTTDQPEKALEALSRCCGESSDDSEALLLRVWAEILLKNYSTAELIVKRVLAAHPTDAAAHLYSGVIAMRRKEWDRALADLNQAISLDSSLAEARKQRARTFMELGEQVRAAADLTQAAEIDPADGEIFALRGLTMFGRMLYDAAVADFTRALERLPGNHRILYDRAVVFLIQDEWEAALKDLEVILTSGPKAARALSLRGVVRARLGKAVAAAEDFDRAIAADGRDPVVWNNRGFFRYQSGDYASAVTDFNAALQLNPDYGPARYNLGLVLDRKESAYAAEQFPSDSLETSEAKSQ